MAFVIPWSVPAIETFPFTIPAHFFDNSWRAAQTADRALHGLPPLPAYPTEAQITIFCRPQANQDAAGSGSGTLGSPYTLILDAINAATGTSVVGISSDWDCFTTNYTLSGASTFITIPGSKNGITVCCWVESGRLPRPTRVRRLKLFGTTAAEWEQVNDAPNGITGGAQITTGSTWVSSSTSGIWHLKTPATLAGNIGFVAYGVYNSTDAVVLDATFSQHGRNSKHVRRAWMVASGGNAVVRTGDKYRLEQDMQFDYLNEAGFICKSVDAGGAPANPATRWGGVYLAYVFHSTVYFNGASGAVANSKWLHALQGDGGGQFLRLNPGVNTLSDLHIEGIYANHFGYSHYLSAGTNPSPVLGAGDGSIEMALGDNATTFGTGQKTWIQDCELYHIRSNNLQVGSVQGDWFRRNRLHDIAHYRTRLTGAGAGSTNYWSKCYVADDDGDQPGAYEHYNEYWNFHHRLGEAGCGPFPDSDGGIVADLDQGTSHIRLHDGVGDSGMIGLQITGSGAGHEIWNIAVLNSPRPLMIEDAIRNGCVEADVSNCYLEMADPTEWQAADGNSQGIEFDSKVFISIDQTVGSMPAKALGDDEARGYRRVRLRNIECGNPRGIAGVTITQNETLRDAGAAPTLPVTNMPWDDTDANGTCRNGQPAAVTGQVQQTTSYVAEMVGIHVVGPYAKRVTDLDGDPDNGVATVQTITNFVESASEAGVTQGGILLDTASSVARTGGAACRAEITGTIAQSQHMAAGVQKCIRGIPLHKRTIGAHQWIPASSGVRTGVV